jgi:antitoxin (DNA-binding transcriptional repressor) of toxin-antitoxin stability system
MSTISVADLKKKSAEDLVKSASEENVVITSDGQPVALVFGMNGISMGMAESVMRSVAALRAQAALQRGSKGNGTSELSPEEIDAEIQAARRDRKK